MTAGLLSAARPVAQAQETATLTTLYRFSGSDGSKPSTLVQGSDGNFYGTTVAGGASDDGTIFELTPEGVLTTLHNFSGDDGSEASPLVQGSDGNFYGTTQQGGANGDGTVFQITPSGTFTTLHTFDGNDGANPEDSLLQGSDGNFYGTTSATVYRIGPSGTFSTLYRFSSDGSFPVGALVQGSDGNFYGTSWYGGIDDLLEGTVFQITPAGVLTTLHDFNDAEGMFPNGGLVQSSDGDFYGTAQNGGAFPEGTVYKITSAGVLTVIHSFNDSDGDEPTDGLILAADGNFYGTTSGGGGSSGDGTVFEITPAGVLTTLYVFGLNESGSPEAGLVQGRDGNFYGTTSGGYNGSGTVFKLQIVSHPAFFTGEAAVGNGAYYLAFPSGNYFGYYSFLDNPNYLFHFDLGYEYVFDANDGNDGVYLYDFASNDFFYTSPAFPFPYLYDFNLQSVVYYYPDASNPGHYNTNGVRYFYVFNTGQTISK